MQIIKEDWKNGKVLLKAEQSDDFWYLHQLIEEGDTVRAGTERKIKIGDAASERNPRVVRKKVTLTLRVEKTELSHEALRVSGVILEGPEDIPAGAHHTITVEAGTVLTLQKKSWGSYQKKYLLESVQRERRVFLLVLFDREEALVAKLTPAGYEVVGRERGSVAKKADMKVAHSSFYAELANIVVELANVHRADTIILASPHFWSGYLQEALPAKLKEKTVSVTCSSVSEAGIMEVLKRPELRSMLQSERAAKEAGLVEEVKAAIAQERSGCGLSEVSKLAQEGNVSRVFVADKAIARWKEEGIFGNVEAVLRTVEGVGGEVHIFSTDDANRVLEGVGGIACIKRW